MRRRNPRQNGTNFGAEIGTEFAADFDAEFSAEIGAKFSTELGTELGTEFGAEIGTEFCAEIGTVANYSETLLIVFGVAQVLQSSSSSNAYFQHVPCAYPPLCT